MLRTLIARLAPKLSRSQRRLVRKAAGPDRPRLGVEALEDRATPAVTSLGALSPAHLTPVGDTVLFTATDTQTGSELWKTDGTVAGTARVKDINPGSGSGVSGDL